MTGDAHGTAALKLSWARMGGDKTAPLPEDVAPASIEDGYKAQDALHKILIEAGMDHLAATRSAARRR